MIRLPGAVKPGWQTQTWPRGPVAQIPPFWQLALLVHAKIIQWIWKISNVKFKNKYDLKKLLKTVVVGAVVVVVVIVVVGHDEHWLNDYKLILDFYKNEFN